MAITFESNELGGETAILQPGDKVDDLPTRFRCLLGATELECAINPSKYFTSQATKVQFGPLKNWLEALAVANSWQWEINIGGGECAKVNEIYLRYEIAGMQWSGIKLRREAFKEKFPFPLNNLYSVIDGMNHCGFGIGGGISRSSSIRLASEAGPWLEENSIGTGKKALSFYSTPDGDGASFTPDGEVYWYEHSFGKLEPFGTLTTFFQRYFSGLLIGKVIGI